MRVPAESHSLSKSDSDKVSSSRGLLHGATAFHSYPSTVPVSASGNNSVEQVAAPKSFPAPVQLKRNRKDDESQTSQMKAESSVIQRVVADDIAANTPIIIDNPQASDFGDKGIVKRHSRVVQNCQAVEFHNEKGTEYRVLNYEMSEQTDKEVAPKFAAAFTVTAHHAKADVVIKGVFNLKEDAAQELEFQAEYKGKNVGELKLGSYGNNMFYLTSIKSDSEFKKVAKGLGTALLYIAGEMGQRLGKTVISLSATKFQDKDHPAPFYHKFGFKAPEALESFGGDWDKYLQSIRNQVVNMDGNSSEISQRTATYISREGWSFGGWSYSGS